MAQENRYRDADKNMYNIPKPDIVYPMGWYGQSVNGTWDIEFYSIGEAFNQFNSFHLFVNTNENSGVYLNFINNSNFPAILMFSGLISFGNSNTTSIAFSKYVLDIGDSYQPNIRVTRDDSLMYICIRYPINV